MMRQEADGFMKKMIALVLALLMCAAAMAGMAEGEGVISQTSCSIVQSGDYYLVYCFAQVYNASDEVICLEEGMLSLMNGEQLLATSDVSQLWPYFLSPGEEGYLFDIVPFEPNEDGVVVPTVTGLSYDVKYMTIAPEFASQPLEASARLEISEGSGEMTVICEIANPTQMDAYDPTIAFGLYAGNGGMIYADGMTLKDVGIPAGQSVLARFAVDKVFVEQWKTYGAEPTEVRVNAGFRNDAD